MDYDPNSDDARWWGKRRDVHEAIFNVARRIESDQSDRIAKLKEYQRLYEDAWRGDRNSKAVVSCNVVRSNIDTVCAKISKNEPRIQILTTGGSHGRKKQAQQLSKFLDGAFREMDLQHKAQLVFRDACIFDGGCLKVYADPDSEKIKCERIYVDEILIDSREAYYGEPRQIFHKRAVHRDVLAALYPKKRGWIMDAPQAKADWLLADRASASMVDVIESWHLPSCEGAKDGRHVICIEGATLFDEPWTRADFPFVFIHWQDPVRGFWMPGLAQEVWGLQAELNTHMENIRVAHRRMGRPMVWLHNASKIDDTEINNEIGAIVRGEVKPEFFATPVMHQQVYQWTEELKSMASEMPGINSTSASGRKQAGLEAAVAIREANDIETERFILVSQRYEQLFLKVADKILRLARQLYDDGVDLTIKSRDKRFIETIKWSDVDMDDDSFDVAMFKVSGLPQRPEGRIQKIIDMTTNGLMTPEIGGDLLGFPDVESAMEKERAPRELLEKMLDAMVEGGEYMPPEPTMDLQLALKRATLMVNWCLLNDVPADETEKIRTFLADTQDLLTKAAPPPPPPPMPMGPDPMMPPPMPMGAVDPSTFASSMPEMAGAAPMPMPMGMMP